MMRRFICIIGISFLLSGCVVEQEPKLIFRGEDAFRGNVANEVEAPEIIVGYEEGSLEEESLEEEPMKIKVLPLPLSVLNVPEIKKIPEEPVVEKRVFDALYVPEEGYLESVRTQMVYEQGYIERTKSKPPREGYLENIDC